jgi:hypothetical protein
MALHLTSRALRPALCGAACCCALFAAVATSAPALAATDSADNSFTWSPDVDCTETCHTRQVATLTDEDTQISASHASFSCTLCHTDVEGMTAGHAKVDADDTTGPKRLKKSTVTSNGCLTCHQVDDGVVTEGAWAASEEGADEQADQADGDAQDTEDVDEAEASEESETESAAVSAIPAYSATATADIDWLTDENGTTVNPHNLPVNKSHNTITCATCHDMHNDETLEETAKNACIQCHHDNVYECFTCHD